MPDDIDDRLRELFHSFDSTWLPTATAPGGPRVRLSRGRAIVWACVIALVIVVAIVSVQLVQSNSVRTPTGPPPTNASTSGACARSQLKADVAFNQPGTELGAVRLTDTSKVACTLFGRPQLVVYDATGHSLGLSESAYQRAPDLPAPKSPIDLAASGSAPQAVVELDWCGFQTVHGKIGIRFSGWAGELVVKDSSIMPQGFSPPACLDPSQRFFAVDYVRAWPGTTGFASVTVAPSNDLHSGQSAEVTVHDFVPHATFYVSECLSVADFYASPAGCRIRQPFKSTNGSGDASVTFRVSVAPYDTSAVTAKVVFCTDQCVIVASAGTGSSATSAFAAIRFAPPPVQQTASCSFSKLTVTGSGGGAALGHEGVVLLFKNTGPSPCSLYGYPGVAGLNAEGVQVTQAVRTLSGYLVGVEKSASQVILAPGESASTIVEGTDNPVGTATTCTIYPKLLVTPPNTTRSVTIDLSLPGCSALLVHPVVPGTSGRAADF
jgi:hypothetical protein